MLSDVPVSPVSERCPQGGQPNYDGSTAGMWLEAATHRCRGMSPLLQCAPGQRPPGCQEEFRINILAMPGKDSGPGAGCGFCTVEGELCAGICLYFILFPFSVPQTGQPVLLPYQLSLFCTLFTYCLSFI